MIHTVVYVVDSNPSVLRKYTVCGGVPRGARCVRQLKYKLIHAESVGTAPSFRRLRSKYLYNIEEMLKLVLATRISLSRPWYWRVSGRSWPITVPPGRSGSRGALILSSLQGHAHAV